MRSRSTTASHSVDGNLIRYIADVFYLPGESDPQVVLRNGVFLNRELLEERLATRYP